MLSQATARRGRPLAQESVRDQVKARMIPTIVSLSAQAIIDSADGSHFNAAPLQNPPIASGLTDTTTRLTHILLKQSAISQQEYQQVPVLLRRIRHLLRVYYDAKMLARKPVEFKYCDMEDINEVGFDLHRCGLTLQLMPGRLRALFRHAPTMDAFLFEEPLDLGRWRAEAFLRVQATVADPESTPEERIAADELEYTAQTDRAARQMAAFVADVLVGWLLVSPIDHAEEHRATLAMEKFVEYTSSSQYQKGDVFGDAFDDAKRVVYQTPDVLLRFAHSGGLPALFHDYASSTAKDGYCKSAVESLPANAWEQQTPESLLGVMKGIVEKLCHEGDTIVTTKPFSQIIHQIYTHYGIEVLKSASTISDSCILFYFLHHRISRKPASNWSHSAIRGLLRKYTNIPEALRRRHGWGILTVSGRWDCLEYYGCVFANCPERTELLELKERRQRGVCNPDAEARLYRWGDETRMCSTCKTVSYCSAACQKADWIFHKSQCKAKDDMETDV